MGCGASAVAEQVEGEDRPNPNALAEPRKSFFRNSIISSILSKDQQDGGGSDSDSVDSAIAVSGGDPTEQNETQEQKHFICNTDVSVEFILETLCQHFEKELDPGCSWIAERLNEASATEAASLSAAIRVTFGWEELEVPSSFVIKVPVSREAREQEQGRVLYSMFKRECNTYEWVQNFPKIVAPEIYHIKKHSNDAGGSVIIMEDLSERGNHGSARDGLSIEVVRDLLKRLALIHAQSRRESSWHSVIMDLNSSYFSSISGKYQDVREFFEHHEVDRSRLEAIKKYFELEYLHATVTESAEELGLPKVLVHGQPFGPNVFYKESAVIGLLNWSNVHSGCFGEDIAKAICWNLSLRDRASHTASLLESYHVHLVRYAGADSGVTFDAVRKAFDRFVPYALVTLLSKVITAENDHSNEPLFERARNLIQNVYTNDKILAEADAHKVSVASAAMKFEGLSKLSQSSAVIWAEADGAETAPEVLEERRPSKELRRPTEERRRTSKEQVFSEPSTSVEH